MERGVITFYDKHTGANTVVVGLDTYRNMPILGAVGAPGDWAAGQAVVTDVCAGTRYIFGKAV